MKSINLFLLCQIDNPVTFRDYANILSRRPQTRAVRTGEQDSLHSLVSALSEKRLRFRAYDSFFYSFNIRHIGKEFDLLKIKADKSRVLNIELKSEMVGAYRIRKQLVQNRYYLSHITLDIRSYTYVSSTGAVYRLDAENNLTDSSIDELREELRDDTGWLSDNIEDLFAANDFLISPTRTPGKFMDGQYFLTQQQETYKGQIHDAISKYQQIHGLLNKDHNISQYDFFSDKTQCDTFSGLFLGISGSPGTGKTLLLYDLAAGLRDKYRICVIHCGKLLPGHQLLRKKGWEIVGIRQAGDSFAFERYDIILVDEAQRLYQNQFDAIKTMTRDLGLVCVFAYDPRQVLLASEMRRDIGLQVERLANHTYRLSEKIRANKELDSFMRVLLQSNSQPDHCMYSHIDVLYARTEKDCDSFRSNYMNRGYTFINFKTTALPGSSYGESLPSDPGPEYDAGKVIGLEFENVVMVLDENFYYDENGVLRAKKHPNPDYLYDQLLYQGITRTREKLCLIIVNNFPLFRHITEMIRGRYG